VISKGFISAFRDGFAPVKIFYAIPSPSFSAAMNCARYLFISTSTASVPVLVWISIHLAKSCSIQHRRLTASDSLEERVVMAKSSMVASTIPKIPIYHGNKDA
jgi:hypothetical protein